MSTFAEDIESEAKGEEILGIVIGGYGWASYSSEPIKIPQVKRLTQLSWIEARPFLDYEYDGGYGAPNCHAITAWTENSVIFVGTYDGSTWVTSVPRNPTNTRDPHMVGGG